MKCALASLMFLLGITWSESVRGDVVLYVNAAATTGGNNGSSWANAFRGSLGLQASLSAAAAIATPANRVQIWVAAGTYVPTSDPAQTSVSFPLVNNVSVYGGFVGTEVSLTQRNPSLNTAILSGVIGPNSTDRSRHVVHATGTDRTAVLDGVVVQSGVCQQGTTDRAGAGVWLSAASPTITGCTIGGAAIQGGGVANQGGGNPLIQNCSLSGSVIGNLGGIGGGLYSDGGTVQVDGSTITGSTGANGDGGGVFSAGGAIVLTQCVIHNGSAETGGGISMSNGSVVLNLCTIDNNTGGSGGNGISRRSGGTGTCTARGCIISNNHLAGSGPYSGGAVGNVLGAFINCTFTGNSASFGVFNAPSAQVIACRFFGDTGGRNTSPGIQAAVLADCIFQKDASYVSATTITNCTFFDTGPVLLSTGSALQNSILWGSPGGTESQRVQVLSGTPTIAYNSVQGWTGGLGGVGNNGLDPLFADVDGPDGVLNTGDEDLRVLPSSPCIDSANANALPLDTYDLDGDGNTAEVLPLDFAGNARWIDNTQVANSGIGFVTFLDRGAFESLGALILYVNAAATTGANNGSSWANAYRGTLGLQAALAAAATVATPASPVQVWVAAGTYVPTSDPAQVGISFPLLSSVSVYGGFAGTEVSLAQRNPAVNVTILSGVIGPNSTDRSRHVVHASGTDRTVVLDGVTIQGGDCRLGGSDNAGAGVWMSAASPTITGCSISGGAILGGGISNQGGGNPLIQNCFVGGTVLGNFGGIGGGLYSDGGTVEVNNCTISGYTGANGDGGGVFSAGGTIVLTQCVIHNGVAETGGGISMSNGNVVLSLCTVDNNITGSGGCGISKLGSGTGTCTARNCVISNNHMASSGPYGGGAVAFVTGAFINCTFTNNSAPFSVVQAPGLQLIGCRFFGDSGGRIQNAGIQAALLVNCVFEKDAQYVSAPVITNCTFFDTGPIQLSSGSALHNCILWGSPGGTEDQRVQILSGTPVIDYCTVQGWTGALGGVGNNGSDPRFMDPVGPDGTPNTGDEDFRLLAASPCVDSANAGALPQDTYDIDGDGNTTEILPLDLNGNARWTDIPQIANTGTGFVTYLDRGPFECVPVSGLSVWAGVGSVFNLPGNWCFGAVPGAADNALFDIGGAYTVQFPQNASIGRLTARSGDVVLNMGTGSLLCGDASYGLDLFSYWGAPASLRIDGGTVTASKVRVRPTATLAGTPTLAALVQNGGNINPGAVGGVGTMTVQGSYQQYYMSPSNQKTLGNLSLDVTGGSLGQYDRLVITGNAELAGGLFVSLLNGFDPPANFSPQIVQATTRTSNFDVAFFPALTNNRFFKLTYPRDGSVYLGIGTLGGDVNFGNSVNSITPAPSAMALGDVNNDGKPDLVLAVPDANPTNPGSVVVLLNAGTIGGVWQGFTGQITILTNIGRNPQGIAVGNFDGVDGSGGGHRAMDIAVSNKNDDTITVITNTGGGTLGSFTAWTPMATGPAPIGVAAGHVTGSAFDDIAVANSGPAVDGNGNPVPEANTVTLFVNRGTGGGNGGYEHDQVPVGPRPTSVAADNVSEHSDGSVDVITGNSGTGNSSVSVRISNNSNPSTWTGPDMPTGNNPIRVLTADFNGDHRPEIVTVDKDDGTVSVIVNTGAGTFAPRVALPVGTNPLSAAALDVDQDGDPDLAVVAAGQIEVLRNNFSGGPVAFAPAAPPPPGPGIPVLVDHADVNSDNRDDLVTITTGTRQPGSSWSVNPNQSLGACYANCDGSTVTPILNANDFQCFLNAFANGNPYANCDASTLAPVLNANDFTCFLSAFAAGCS